MQLKLDSNNEGIVLYVLSGPLEEYSPTDDIKELFKEVEEIDKRLRETKELYTKITKKVEEINNKENTKLSAESPE